MITTVAGNYPKVPSLTGGPNLRRSIAQYDEGRISGEELSQAQDEATQHAIAEQVEAGIELVTDGQLRWDDGQTYFASRLDGFSINGLIRYFDSNTYYRQPVVESKVAWKGPISVRDFQFATSVSAKPVKVVVTGPYTMAKLSNIGGRRMEELVMELAAALNREAQALQEAGATFIQFDEPSILKAKGDFALFQEAAKLLTQGITVKTALYTYFGDIQGIAPQLFSLPFQVYGLDFIMGPANFALLDSFPRDKELGLGIIDARNTKMEEIDEIVDSVRRVKNHVSLDRLYLNPSCGLEFLPRSNAYNKLVRLVEGARRAQEVLS